MYAMPEGYQEAMQADTREIDIYLAVGTNVDQTAADDIVSITANTLPMTNTAQLTDAIYEIEPGLATFEQYGIKSSADAGMIAPPIQATAYPPEVGMWSDVISDGDGNIDWSFTVELSKAHTSALSVFTREVGILEAEVTFYNGDSQVATGAMEAGTNKVQYPDAVTYTRFTVHVTKIESPFSHVRVVEIEFGASQTLSKTTLTGTVSIIQEFDPTMLSIPLYELDFTILNVMGDWDIDNPTGMFNQIQIGYPIEAGLTCRTDGGQFTIPLGRFIVSEKKGSDTELSVTCYDPRKTLQDIYMTWSLSTETDLGTTITGLFTDAHIPHVVADGVFDIVPDNDITFDENTSMLDAMKYICQYYGVWLIPYRDGFIHVETAPPSDDYGDVMKDMVYQFPTAYGFTSYNHIQVSYGTQENTQYYALDFRANTTQVKSQISINNPLVLTQEKAQALANKVRASLYTQMVEMEWRTDLMNDMGDTMGMYGKWSQTIPTDYRCVYQDIQYDGGLSATVRGIL